MMAYTFNGSSQYISATHPVADVPLTLACWFKSNSATGQGLVNISSLGGNNYRVQLQANLAAKPLRATQQGLNSSNSAATGTAESTTGYTAGDWAHACGVFASITSRTVYLNGDGSATDTTQITTSSAAIDRLWIGANSNSAGPALYCDGSIAEVGVWNVALTAAEVAILATGASPTLVRPQSLVFYAPLIRDLVDLRGGLSLTNNNTATASDHSRVYL